MVHVDLEELRAKWYDMGKFAKVISASDHELFKSLDLWQKKELVDAFVKGNKEFQLPQIQF